MPPAGSRERVITVAPSVSTNSSLRGPPYVARRLGPTPTRSKTATIAPRLAIGAEASTTCLPVTGSGAGASSTGSRRTRASHGAPA